MTKPDFCHCENKDADQLCINHTSDHRFCFRYSGGSISLPLKSKISIFKAMVGISFHIVILPVYSDLLSFEFVIHHALKPDDITIVLVLNFYINGPGHITKMAAIAINSLNL